MSVAAPSQTTPPLRHHRSPLAVAAVWTAGALFLLVLGVLLWGLNMRRGLNHDEHQFIAAAALMARAGMTPYVDFPYFHLPLLSQIYAVLFRVAPNLLLTARAVSVIGAWLTLGLLLTVGFRLLQHQPDWLRLLLGAAGAALLAATPLFVYTSGRAWNHDLPMLLALLAAVLVLDAIGAPSGDSRPWRSLAVGLLLGLAVSLRASFALLAPAFLVGLWWGTTGPVRAKLSALVWLIGGSLIGTLPSLILLMRAPQEFVFGNLTYVQLNTRYYAAQAAAYPGMTLAGKLQLAVQLLVAGPANALPLLLFGGMALWVWPQAATTERRQLITLALLCGAALLSALAATPAQTQYFYLLLPLGVLGALYATPMLPRGRQRLGVGLIAAGALGALLLTGRSYGPGVAIVADPDAWYPRKVHARGELIAGLVGQPAPVLTLAPTHILEGDLPIYPSFATGPFAWRVADLVEPTRRAALSLVGPTDLPALLTEAPRALLTGLDNDDVEEEQLLIDYAQDNGYLPIALPDEGVLWVSPLADWDGLVRLGAVQRPHLPLHPADTAVVTLYLQAIQPIDRDLNLLVRLVNADGKEIWRAEGWPYGTPTSSWQPGDVWPDGYEVTIPPSAESGLYKLEASLYDPATLEPVGAPVAAAVLPVGDAAEIGAPVAELGDAITLHAPQVTIDAAGDGPSAVIADLVWQAGAPPPADLVRFVQALDADGQVANQSDGPVLDGFLPTQDWPLATPIRERVTLTLEPGVYTLITGFYDAATQARLPVRVDGQAAGDALIIETVRVQ